MRSGSHQPAKAKIAVNSTRFVSSTSLTANITVAPDAAPVTYDIAVVTRTGKKGIGAMEMPGLHQPVGENVRYHVRAGKHDVTAYDWEQFLKFAREQWAR